MRQVNVIAKKRVIRPSEMQWTLQKEIDWIDEVISDYPGGECGNRMRKVRHGLLPDAVTWLYMYLEGLAWRVAGFNSTSPLNDHARLRIAAHVGLRIAQLRTGEFPPKASRSEG